jgi:pimeloyl-ACP methyl ester carboxylesterase
MDALTQFGIAIGRTSLRSMSRRRFIGTGLAGVVVGTASMGRLVSAEETSMDGKAVTSKDGTRIAFDRSGDGPALVLVGGALSQRSAWAPVTTLLAPRFTVFSYDRRGRGGSGDTAPYAVEREIEDLEAIIDQAGGAAFVHGQSSGAVLALRTTASLPTKVQKLSLYEPPFIVDDSRPPPPADYVSHIDDLITTDRRGEAVEYWMTDVVLAPPETVAQMKSDPSWPALEAVAHTLPYDIAVLGDGMSGNSLRPEQWVPVSMPTLVMDGGASPQWIRNSAWALAEILPDAEHQTLEGQLHNAAPEALAPAIERFFLG